MADAKVNLPDPPKTGGWKAWLQWALLVAALLAGTYASTKPGVTPEQVKEVVKQELAK